jgi:hypothetical protein
MKNIIIGLSIVGLLVLGFVCVQVWKMNLEKARIGMQNELTAQVEKKVEVALFGMRTKIKNIHNCTDEWADKFIAVVAAQSKGREGGGMFKMSTESASLGLSPEMHMKLANVIEGEIGNFMRQQEIAVDMWQNLKTFCEDPWHNIGWLGMNMAEKIPEEPMMITSKATKATMETGEMEEELF